MIFSFFLTDIAYLSVLFFGAVGFFYSLRRAQTRASLTKVLHHPLALMATIILMFFVFISVLDSIHMRYNTEPLNESAKTLLDRSLAPLGQSYEKSYSKPMALTLFLSELSYQKGAFVQTYPRLSYPPQDIKNSADVRAICLHHLWWAFLSFVLICSFILGIVYLLSGVFHVLPMNVYNKRAWLLGTFTFAFCVALLIFLYTTSRTLHVFGTGKIGEDVLYYALKSIRTGLVIGLVTTLIMMPLALLFGVAAGYFGGFIDDVIQYVYTTLSSVPGVLLITAAILSLETYIVNHPDTFKSLPEMADARLLALCLILGVTSWTSLCRLVRAEVLKLRESDYVLAAYALGSGAWRIISKHLFPNVMHIVVITVILDFSYLVLAEAVLSYVGVGVSSSTMSWGNMINAARLELAREPLVWWPVTAAFTFMFALVLAANIFADAIRDAFDPHHLG